MQIRILILKTHGIGWRITAGRLLADEMIPDRDGWADVTEMSLFELYTWLGY